MKKEGKIELSGEKKWKNPIETKARIIYNYDL